MPDTKDVNKTESPRFAIPLQHVHKIFAEAAAHAEEFLHRHRCSVELNPKAFPPVPSHVVLHGGKPFPQQPSPQEDSMPFERYVDKVLGEMRESILVPDKIMNIGTSFDSLVDTVSLRLGAPTSVTKIDLPSNHTMVMPAAHAVVRAIATEPESTTMQIDTPALIHEMDRSQMFDVLSRPFSRALKIFEANKTQSLGKVSEMVRNGLDRARSVVMANASLMDVLEPALELVGGPAAEAVRTRRANLRMADEIKKNIEAAAAAAAKDKEAAEPDSPTSGARKLPR